MTEMLFFRLLAEEDKETALAEAVGAVRDGQPAPPTVNTAAPQTFRLVPGSPFAYWVSERLRRKFMALLQFESVGRTVKQGLATADDFHFVRVWWEVASVRVVGSEGYTGADVS